MWKIFPIPAARLTRRVVWLMELPLVPLTEEGVRG